MDKMIFFDNAGFKICKGQAYYDFLNLAFRKTDAFGLVYINYNNKQYRNEQKRFIEILRKHKIKSINDPGWPRCYEETYNSSQKIVFYRFNEETKEILMQVEGLDDWSGANPCNLCFFKGNQCWFYSVNNDNENIAAIIHADKEDINFLEEKGFASREKAFIPTDDSIVAYDEVLVKDNTD